MSIVGALRQAQLASQFAHIDQPTDNRLNLADHLHVRQVERMLQQTLEELEQVKARLSRLEKSAARRNEPAGVAGDDIEQSNPEPLTPPLPIAEISQIAEMAKRFR
jgi:hypothetical protein